MQHGEHGQPILVILNAKDYRRLVAAAAAEFREPDQQAAMYVRQALPAEVPNDARAYGAQS